MLTLLLFWLCLHLLHPARDNVIVTRVTSPTPQW